MKRIASRANPTFKALRQLARDAGTGRGDGQVVLEGTHLADAFLSTGGVPLAVFVGDSALGDRAVVALLERVGESPRHAVADALFASISGLAEALPFLMVVARPRPDPPPRMTRTSLLIDRVQDPGNVGSILRSAAAAGIVDVHLSTGCAGAWSPKVIRAAMGAHFRLRLFEGSDLAALRRESSLPWIATSPHAPRSLFDADLRGEVAWLFGNEGQGVDPALVDTASAVRIPQSAAIESLNVAASAAVCLFEQVRQRASS